MGYGEGGEPVVCAGVFVCVIALGSREEVKYYQKGNSSYSPSVNENLSI